MTTERTFSQALKRGLGFHNLDAMTQWDIDKSLGILDWEGNCPHKKDGMCPDCEKKYDELVRGKKD